ncbi:hypothetical protein B0H65DRAFT_165070 [Neurospora tetraspora]|uniref:Uncharacterized protein n=1 Tax=Neurospora tetraspora TaxID=94610 RepID=A0AAE0JHN8_9PEZI|nr:hypothetical protein B0H65DRAFT_165070 [Neurospora tetraspora]
MFGNFAHLIPLATAPQGPPKDVPPPTPVNFPRFYPQVQDDQQIAPGAADETPKSVVTLLQGIVRPAQLAIAHFEALGVHVVPNSTAADLIPDPSYIPDFAAWEELSSDAAHEANESTRVPLVSGNRSPGCNTYLERKRELLFPNETGYRTVRRIQPPKGQSHARLGNCYEFFRQLDMLSNYWDDTSVVDQPAPEGEEEDKDALASKPRRTGAGNQMPPDFRQQMVQTFLKLVAYDFGCNTAPARAEPRLHITSRNPSSARSSYFSSGCTFMYKTPTTREEARAGIVEGPVAAVSARHSTGFPPPPEDPNESSTDPDHVFDLGRELVAALVTAQHRAREGRTEKRIGEGAWWCTKPRWGGGPGGPIGREIEQQTSGDDTLVGDKDAPPPAADAAVATAAAPAEKPAKVSISSRLASRASPFGPLPSTRLPEREKESSSGPAKGVKRLKKSGNMAMYDNYRMVRPPALTWDKKAKYAAIGRAAGAEYDDIFVVSALYHHISIVRVRVPDQLMAVLEGRAEHEFEDGKRSWGKLEVRRSKWFDLFKPEDRVEAMKLVWCMMNWLMRAVPKDEEEKEKVDQNQEGKKDTKSEKEENPATATVAGSQDAVERVKDEDKQEAKDEVKQEDVEMENA